ncbi:MAG: valine--tRNA ligase [Nitrososphaerota archaeon]|nr:valine--tRNA ligase [Nitrososphaerota archaeon]
MEPKIKETRWDTAIESSIIDGWERDDLYSFDKASGLPVYSIDTPPPYINTQIHIGQAYTYVWMDAIARYRRMTGNNVLFPLGFDRNGLPIEVQTEKEYKVDIRVTPREEFLAKCEDLLNRYTKTAHETFRRLGIGFNSYKRGHDVGGLYETDDPEFRKLTQRIFLDLFARGLIYESERTSNYCIACGTSLSDAEVEYREEETTLYSIRFQIADDDGSLTIATTRPELLAACKAIIFNPTDERYRNYEGRKARVPLFGQEVPIRGHPYAKPDYGSGLVMICSYGDQGDIAVFKDLGLAPTFLLGPDGRMNKLSGKYAGLKVREAREEIASDLAKAGLVVKEERIVHRQPICWRSHTPIEFIPQKEIYLKQLPFVKELLDAVAGMKFFAPESRKLLTDWINGLSSDWVISRHRYYGTEIPLWYCKSCGATYAPPPGKYYRPWKEDPPINRCPSCGGSSFVGEGRIFDTWFDSSNTELYITGYPLDRHTFGRAFPVSLRPQGKEIVRSWLYFTLLKSYLITGAAPFKDVWIHMHVVDERGEKMSKSLGNTVDPNKVLDQFGAEAFRVWAFLEGNITEGDIRYSQQRVTGNQKFLTKLWNVSRLISSFPIPSDDYELLNSDRWIIAELAKLIDEVRNSNESYMLNRTMLLIRDFTWYKFADHYIELAKPRAYGVTGFSEREVRGAWFTLHLVLRSLLLLIAPFIPMMSDRIFTTLYSSTSIHKEMFPSKPTVEKDLSYLTDRLLEFNSYVWNYKKERKLALKDPISLKIPDELKPFERDLRAMHNIASIAQIG